MRSPGWPVIVLGLLVGGCHPSSSHAGDASPDVFVVSDPLAFRLSPTSQDFGTVAVGRTSAPVTFVVSNPSGVVFGRAMVSLTGQFTETSDCRNPLAPGESCRILVVFAPQSPGSKNGSLTVASPTLNGVIVSAALAGTGAVAHLAVSPMSRAFTGMAGTRGEPVTFTVATIGDGSTGPLTVALGGANADSFALTSQGCAAPLAGLSTCQLTVALDAKAAGTKSATLSVASPVGGMAQASLSAEVTR
jgi:hypothetical protein